jgi:PAS domain S-box-containing protein
MTLWYDEAPDFVGGPGREGLIQMPRPRQADRMPDVATRPTVAGSELLAVAADWLWGCGTDSRFTYLSPEFSSTSGLPPRLLLGRHLFELAPADARSSSAPRAAVSAGKPFRGLLLRLDGADRSAIWLEIAGTPFVGAGGAFSGYRGIGKTVTAEINAILALRKSERRHRELFEVASDWFWETDTDNRLVYVSPNGEAAIGLTPSAYHGKRLADANGMMIAPETGRANLAAIRARQPYHSFVFSRHLPNGTVIWISSSGSPFYGDDGSFHGYRGIARDVTAQIEAERALRERSRDLVKQILAFGRKEEYRQESVDIAVVLREALRLMRATVPTSIRVVEEITPPPPVIGDRDQLHQVIVNLVSNAAQAIGDAHGTITVGLSSGAGAAELRLWIADTGCGMDEATKAQMFEPFFTTKDVGKATGLGLVVVHGIIKGHGGRIDVQSTPGSGTRIDVLLPSQGAAGGVAA